MSLMLTKEPTESIPLKMNRDNVIFIGDTRVTFDTVVDAFTSGATPEEIVYQYPSLSLADIYAVVGYYLHHQMEVHEYLTRRQLAAQRVQEQNQTQFSPKGIRERLLARDSDGQHEK